MSNPKQVAVRIFLWVIVCGTIFIFGLPTFRMIAIFHHPDYNRDLTRMAKTGLPIVQTAVEFNQKNGRSPTIQELRVLVKDPHIQTYSNDDLSDVLAAQYPHEKAWRYAVNSENLEYSNEKKGFFMVYRFTFEDGLVYKYDGTQGHWCLEKTGNDIVIHLDP